MRLFDPRVLLALVLLAALGWWQASTHYTQAGRDALLAEQTVAAARMAADARAIEFARMEVALKAQDEDAQRQKRNARDLAAARTERAGLLDDLAAARAAIPQAGAEAVRAYAAATTDVFEQCTARYLGVAEAADGHAADALLFEQSWPER